MDTIPKKLNIDDYIKHVAKTPFYIINRDGDNAQCITLDSLKTIQLITAEYAKLWYWLDNAYFFTKNEEFKKCKIRFTELLNQAGFPELDQVRYHKNDEDRAFYDNPSSKIFEQSLKDAFHVYRHVGVDVLCVTPEQANFILEMENANSELSWLETYHLDFASGPEWLDSSIGRIAELTLKILGFKNVRVRIIS